MFIHVDLTLFWPSLKFIVSCMLVEIVHICIHLKLENREGIFGGLGGKFHIIL